MHVVYTGPFEGVVIAELDRPVTHGVLVEVPDDLGERLCQQDCWEPAKAGRGSAVSEERD